MDSYEFNKIAGYVLAALLLSLGLNFFASAVFAAKKPALAGYALPADEPKPDPGAAAAVTVPLPELLAKADEKRGQTLVRQCTQCHSLTEAPEGKPGPPLFGIINRKVATYGGFAYSQPMKAFAGTKESWDFETLDKFIANPRGVVRNTTMSFNGFNRAEDRAHLLSYLRTLAKEPVPLPK
jgi:cytochrome c